MKFLTAMLFTFFAMGVSAQEDVASMKSKANEHLDKKITRLNEAKTCVQGATTLEAVKACKFDLHQDMKMMKEEKMDEQKKEEAE